MVFTGVGDPPPGKGHLGYCSQAACFIQSSLWNGNKETNQCKEILNTKVAKAVGETYKLLFEYEFPSENSR